MSEHQVIAFRAVDKPVSNENLAFMEAQSTRADVTPWTFDNEYNYGDFRGDTLGMLRRGYDIFFHYANFGTRLIYFRFADGLPHPEKIKPYLMDGIFIEKDKKGPGCILCCEPCYDAEMPEIWEPEPLIEAMVNLRRELLDGDMRSLYLIRIAVGCDMNHDSEEETEGPVPPKLDDPTAAQDALLEWLDLPAAIFVVGPQGQRLDEPRYVEDILEECEEKAEAVAATAKKKVQAARKKELSKLAADPHAILKRAEALMAATKGNSNKYKELIPLLVDLHDALSDSPQANLAIEFVNKLREQFPQRRAFFERLEEAGFGR